MGMGGSTEQINLWLRGETLPVDLNSPRPLENEDSIRAGRLLYEMWCAACHGMKGDGNGEKAGDLQVKPRDFTFAIYKFRTTPTGALPTDEDIFKTVSRGLYGTSMLPWIQLTTHQRWQVVYYVKTFSDFFKDEGKPEVVKVPKPTRSPGEYIEHGKNVYEMAKCYECHGREGYGDGVKKDKLKDDWFLPIRPTNFWKHVPKRGLEIDDIYLTVATGLNGTPMPSYSLALTEDEMLSVSYYVRSLAPERGSELGIMLRNVTPDERVGMMLWKMQSSVFDENKGEILLIAGIAILILIFFLRKRKIHV